MEMNHSPIPGLRFSGRKYFPGGSIRGRCRAPQILLAAFLLTFCNSYSQTGPAGVNTGIGAWWKADASGTSGTSWTDQSGNNRTLAQGNTASRPTMTGGAINYLPALDFDGNDFMSSATVLGTGSTQNVAIFAVAQPEDAGPGGRVCGEYTSNGYPVGIHFPFVDNNFYWDAPYGYRVNGNWQGSYNTPYVISTTKTPNAMYAYSNHKTIASYTAGNLTCICPGNNSSFTVGAITNWGYFGGKIAEVIVYKNSAALTALDRQKIESYLALKYGITLDQATAYNYLASDGTTIIWNASANATWNKNIFGIGRDNTSGLYQKQGRTAQLSSRIFSMAVGSSIAADNASNTGSIANDKTFLVMGDNGGTTRLDQVITNPVIEKVMARTWRVQKSASWADQTITMSAGVSYANKYIVISNTSSSFATITNTVQLDANGAASFSSALLPDGAYLTIGQAPTGPGGVAGNIRLWLDGNKNVYSDAGVTPATDGSVVDQWGDQSQSATGNGSFVTGCNCGVTAFRANGLNYNGAIDNTGNVLRGLTNTAITSPNISSFMAVNSPSTYSGHRYYTLYSNASGGYDYNTNLESIVFGLNGTNIQTHRGAWENPALPSNTVSTMVMTSLTTATAHSLNLNGKQGGSASYVKGNYSIDQFFVGGGYAAGWCCGSATTERYGEIVTYDRALSAVETRKVESYLAMKWGTSLDQTTPTDYVASDWNGTTGTKMWVNDNDGYNLKIFGIGRDDNGQLYQRQSTTSDTNKVFAVAMGTTFPQTNAANTNTIATDKTFLVLASNGAGTKINVPVSGFTNSGTRMSRIWKVDKSATWTDANVTIQTIGTTAKYLLVSSDAVFGAGDAEYQLDGNGQVTLNSSVLQHGYFITFANKISGPANVSSGIVLWMDARTANSGAMANGTGWQDNSGSGKDFDMVFGTPTRYDSVNFNRFMSFNGSSYVRSSVSPFVNTMTAGDVFVVTRSRSNGNNGYPYDFGTSSRGNHLVWSNNCEYNGFGSNQRIGYNSSNNTICENKTGVASIVGTMYPNMNRWNLHNTYSATNSWGTAMNGLFKATTSTNTVNFSLAAGNEHIGAFSGAVFTGDIAEVVLYNRKLSALERQQVNSYLGLKYGITIDQGTPQNYLASDGTTLMWQNDNDGFNMRISGLGRDNITYLHQKLGTNQDTGTIWTVGLGNTTSAVNNFNNPASVSTDKTFLTFADNNLGTQYLSNVSGANVNVRMNRVWKVDKSATWADQNITLTAGSTYGSNKYLLISTTSNFAAISQELLLDATGSVTINSSLLPHNAYFTIGTKIIGPASVNTGIAAWWRSDIGASNAVWNDYSGSDKTAAQGTGAAQPTAAQYYVNYNPVMGFNSAQYMISPSLFTGTGITDCNIFLVNFTNNYAQQQIPFGEYMSNGGYVYAHTPWVNGYGYWFPPYGWSVNNPANAVNGMPSLWTFTKVNNTSISMFQNSKTIATSNGGYYSIPGNNSNFYIGARQDGYNWNGGMAEMIVYNNSAAISANKRRAIESYLAVKWGVSLDSTQGNYLAYDSTAIWDQTVNAGFRWRVTGIGRDDRSGLNQKQSRNWDTSSQGYAIIGLNNIETNNALNASSFGTDKSYLLWGDNNASSIVTTTLAGSTVTPNNPTLLTGGSTCIALSRFAKIYRVQKTGTVGAVQVKINTSGLSIGKTANDYYLAVNNTNAFNSGTVQQLIQASAYDPALRTLTFNNVNFNNGDYFTVIGKKAQAPANVVNGIKLWLKAEDGITLNGNNVSGWDDQSPANKNLSQVTATAQPTYNANTNLINFNPTVGFDGNDMLAGNSLLGTATYPGATFFAVSNQAVITSSSLFYEPSSGTQFNLHCTWSDNNVYWDAPYANNRLTYATGGVAGQNILWSGLSNSAAAAGSRQILYRNGQSVATGSGTSVITGTNSPFNLGGATAGTYNGRIGEVVIYTAPLVTSDIQKIHSYLSLKWGLSLDQTTPANYYASDWNGTTGTLLWNATVNNAYKYRITGIGRDDCSDLTQRQSRNQDTTSKGFATIGIGNIGTTNAGNAANFAVDKSFVMWGDDNGSGVTATTAVSDGTTTIAPAGCVQLRRMTKRYKVAVTGTPGAVQVQINVNGLPLGKRAADFYLARNSIGGGNFNSGTYGQLIAATSFINGIVTFDNVTFNNNDSFTVVGLKTQAPAGVSTGIAVWLKAEDGINLNGTGVSTWEDQSSAGRNAVQATAGNQPVYSVSGNVLSNFNPTVTTGGAQQMAFTSTIPINNMKIFAVGNPLTNAAAGGQWRTLLRGNVNDHPIIIQAGSALYGFHDNTFGTGFKSSGLNTTGIPQLFGMSFVNGGTTQTAVPTINGKAGTTLTGIATTSGADQFMSWGGGQPWGTVSEIVMYNSTTMTATDVQKIQSYLALKYGITLDQTTPYNYVSGGGSVIWDATANAAYSNRITGIGRDDCSDLEQDQSRNVDTTVPGYVTMARGDLYPDNTSNPNKFTSDKSFVLWGDDNVSGMASVAITGDGTTTLPQSSTCTQFRRLGKTFKVSSISNGTAGSNSGLQVSLNVRGLSFGGSTAGVYLAINNSNSFGGTVNKLVSASSFANNTYTFDNVTFNNGDYFTLVGPESKAPANITNGIQLWLKADAGTTLNGTTVSNWGDQSFNSNDASQATATLQPVLVTNGANFNPGLYLSNADFLDNSTAALLNTNSFTALAEMKTLSAAFNWGGVVSYNHSGNTLRPAITTISGAYNVGLNQIDVGATNASVTVPFYGYQVRTSGNATTITATLNGGASSNTTPVWTGTGTVPGYMIGRHDGNAGNSYTGYINEVIVYNRELTAPELQKIESYLAIKYGNTYNAGNSDYKASDNTTIWTAASNSGYKFHLTGIGRDDCSQLTQKQSRNADTITDAGVIIGLNGIAGTNAANTASFNADKAFDVWGDNNGSITYQTAVTGTPAGTAVNYTLGRIWKVQETGTIGSVRVAIPYNKVANPSQAYLLVNNNTAGATFGSGSTAYALSVTNVNGVNYYYADVDLNNGDYFTFGSAIKAPGGVAKTSLWLRPDYGTSSNIDGAAVNEWLDYAAQLNNSTQNTVASQPLYSNNAADNINFNPVLKFNGTSQQMDLDITKLPLGTSARAIAAVGVPSAVTGTNKYIISYGSAGTSQAQGMANVSGTGYYVGYGDDITTAAGFWQTGTVNDMMLRWRGGAGGLASMYSKNKLVGGPVAKNWNTTTAGGAKLGLSVWTTNELWAGTMGDVIVFNDSLTPAERQRVSTYLAIKYGYTLDQATPTDYIATNGTTKVWDNTVAGVYKKNIAGIGRDDAEGLNQIQSKSTNAGVQVAIANTAFATDNPSNSNSFSADNSYLTWSDDSAATTYLTLIGGTNPVANSRMSRLWKVQETGTVGSVQVAIPYNAVANPSAAYIVRSTDATIDATDNFTRMDSIRINGALYYAANVNFNTGDFFTFASSLKLPGGVAGVGLWLRPDYGTSSTVDSTAINEWLDAAGYVNHGAQATVTSQPLYRNNTTSNINFNPVVNFDGSNDELELDITKLPTGTTARSLFMTGKTNIVDGAYHYALAWGTYATSQGSALANGASGLGSFVSYGSNDVPSAAGFWQVGVPNSLSGTWAGGTGNATLYSKNKLIAGPLAKSWVTGTGGARIGANSNTTPGEYWNGAMGDVIVFPYALNAGQRQKVESYLAVKYGYSMDTTSQPNYLASDSSVTWNYNSTYRNRVTGIGRDDLTALNQRQSRNIDTTSPGFVTMGLGSVAATNTVNANTFSSDKSFLLWADDGVAGKATAAITGDAVNTLPTAGPCANYIRMAKTYKVQRTNFTQPVQVQVNVNGMTIGKALQDYYLAINTTATMSGTISKLVPATSIANGVLTFDNVDFSANGDYFTVIGQKVQSPASIQTANLKLWLKAEDGIILNGTTVQEWDDNGPALNNAIQATVANQPTYNNAASLINFNPALTFNGTNNRFSLATNLFGTGNISYTVLGIVNSNAANTTRVWLSDGTVATNQAVSIGHLSSNVIINANWNNDLSGGAVTTGVTYLEGFTRDNVSFLRTNNLYGKNVASNSVSGLNKINTLASIGSDPGSGQLWSGQIGEILAYQAVLTPTEQRKINSYLAVKWGLTMAGGDSSYLASDGTVIWNATSNTGYKNRITGIGKDLCYDLTQRQSRNQATGSLLTFGLGSIVATNAGNNNDFASDKSYTVVGDDNGSNAEQTTNIPAGYVPGTKRLARQWKAAVTGTAPSNLELQFDLSATGLAAGTQATDLELAIDTDGDGNFATGTIAKVQASSWTGGTATFDNVTLSNNAVFTVVTKKQPLKLNVKVYMQGDMPSSGTTMHNDLQNYFGGNSGLLPTTDPYGAGAMYNQINNPTGPAGTVTDWVQVDVRYASNPTRVVESNAFLLKPNGSIVDSTGSVPTLHTLSYPDTFCVVVSHRNHMAVVSKNILLNSGSTAAYDFTTSLSQAANPFGDPAQMVQKNGVWCMWAGDINRDYFIDGTDYGTVYFLNSSGPFDVYDVSDLNMDGFVDGTDLGLMYFNNSVSPYSTLINY
ncbi:beta strand repeat-containing protein [Chitinophagaceae bacterium MMS25-I14]